MRTCPIEKSILQKRRQNLAEKLPARSAMIIPAHPEFIRNNDVHHSYRQDSSLYYLTTYNCSVRLKLQLVLLQEFEILFPQYFY